MGATESLYLPRRTMSQLKRFQGGIWNQVLSQAWPLWVNSFSCLVVLSLSRTFETTHLFKFYPLLNEPVVIDRNNKLILVKTKHWTLEDYRKKLPDFSEYHSFGFVRNPWARMAAINGSANHEGSAIRGGLLRKLRTTSF